MLVGYLSNEYYAALADAVLEFSGQDDRRVVVRSSPSGAVHADLSEGDYEVCLAKAGHGSKRVRVALQPNQPIHFRLLSDGLLGYAWPKWCREGDRVEFRV